MTISRTAPHAPVIIGFHAILFLSGAGSLGYQIVWSRQLGLGLGQEMVAVLAVACAVLTGLAAGAWLFDRSAWLRARPLRTYALAEAMVGGWGALSLWTLPVAASWARQWIGLEPSSGWQWAVSFFVPLLALSPASLALGTTFPAMEAVLQRRLPSGGWVGSLYGCQTLGAVLGVLGGGLGLEAVGGAPLALGVFAAANGLCAVGALWLGRGATDDILGKVGCQAVPPQSSSPGARRLLTLLAATGLLGLGYEVLAVRVLREVLEGTVYTYAVILAVYLTGGAAGAMVQARVKAPLRMLFGALAVACWGSWWMARWSPGLYSATRACLGDAMVATVTAEGLAASGVLLLPAFFMGWTFAELAQSVRNLTGRLGLGVAVNMLAAASSPLAFGLWLGPVIGFGWSGVTVVGGYLLLAALEVRPRIGRLSGESSRFPPREWLLLAVLLVGAVVAKSEPGRLQDLPAGSRVVAECRGVAETARVIEDSSGQRTLRVGLHLNMGGTGAARWERLQAHIPLLLHPAPRHALFLGAGTGITLGCCLSYPDLDATGVELLPEVAGLAGWFDAASSFKSWPPRIRLATADARRFVQIAPGQYDVIVGDLFHPGRDGAAGLFTREHFAAVRARLAEKGFFLQWLPLHQLQGRALKSVVRTFQEVFPEAQAWWLDWDVEVPVLGLLGGREGHQTPVTWLEEDPSLAEVTRIASAEAGLPHARSVLFRLAADAATLRRWTGDAPLNTDAMPVLTFLAPRLTVRTNLEPFAPVRELLALPVPSPDSVLLDLKSAGGEALSSRIVQAWEARNLYLNGEIAEAERKPEEAIARWLDSAAESPDFTTGYARCLSLAAAWVGERPAEAEELLRRLDQVRPERPVARDLLRRLFPDAPGSVPSIHNSVTGP
ncbi:MAG: fused MFS/spermidine synthase [Verrucomicrobiales bacterium]|nr:fused MFS/spermidine synthase [Verrucomicrobiales bacterium]